MTDSLQVTLTLAAAVGSGIVGGFFLAFSVCVMRALGDLPPQQGIAAMRRINVVVINPWFMTAFLGTALVCVALAAATLLRGSRVSSFVLLGAALYLVGSFLVTMVWNVPRNNALERADPAGAAAERLWADYLVYWTRWNHVRTAASIAASAVLVLALARAG